MTENPKDPEKQRLLAEIRRMARMLDRSVAPLQAHIRKWAEHHPDEHRAQMDLLCASWILVQPLQAAAMLAAAAGLHVLLQNAGLFDPEGGGQ